MSFLQLSHLDLRLADLTKGGLEGSPVVRLAFALALSYIVSQVCVVIYRLTLHPLAKLPGPKFHAATHFPFLYQTYIEASAPRKVLAMHRKYGPIVRISPNQIAVDGSIGWPEVFAHASKNKQEFHKPHGNYAAGDTTSLIAAPKERHRHIRRALAHAFSDTSLNEHEVTLKLYMDLLMDRLGTMEKENKTFNIIHWLNFMSFDIIGDLSFSEPFGSLANNGYHPWIMSIFDGIRGNARRRFLRHYPTLRVIVNALGLNKEFDIGVANRKAASDMAQRRMDMGQEGPDGKKDYLSYMMRKNRDGETTVTDTEILSTSPILVVAGSETTATALTGLFFFLSQNPEKRDLLVEEIKDAYSSQEEVTMRNSARLEYLHATLDETLRLYPPVLANPARLSPGAELGGYYIPKDTWISVHQYSTFRNPKNFHRPEEFIPERWLSPSHPLYDSSFAGDNRIAFKPFSHGSRDCIGKNLAYAEMRMITARILRSFEVNVVDQPDWMEKQRTFTLWEKIPLEVQLKARSS